MQYQKFLAKYVMTAGELDRDRSRKPHSQRDPLQVSRLKQGTSHGL